MPSTPALPAHLAGPAYEWALWSTTVRVVTDDPHALPSARRLIEAELARVELAASWLRRDSEVSTLVSGRRSRISTTLTAILGAALVAARETDGVVDPTVTGDWRGIHLDEEARTVYLPRGTCLDLSVIAIAWAADRCAAVVAETLRVGVLVSLGGDIATAGPAGSSGDGAWEILVGQPSGRPDGSAALVALPTGLSISTADAGMRPRAGWRSATVVAIDALTARTWATAALADRPATTRVLADLGLPARVVGADGSVRCLAGWPDDAEVAA